MKVRKDIRNSLLFSETVDKYRNKIKKDFIITSIFLFFVIFVIGSIIQGVKEGFTLDTFYYNFIFFIIFEIFYFLTLVYKFLVPCRVLEIEVQAKKEVGTDEDTIYKIREYKKWYKVEDWETFSKIQVGNVYYFLCRGKKIVDLVVKEY